MSFSVLFFVSLLFGSRLLVAFASQRLRSEPTRAGEPPPHTPVPPPPTNGVRINARPRELKKQQRSVGKAYHRRNFQRTPSLSLFLLAPDRSLVGWCRDLSSAQHASSPPSDLRQTLIPTSSTAARGNTHTHNMHASLESQEREFFRHPRTRSRRRLKKKKKKKRAPPAKCLESSPSARMRNHKNATRTPAHTRPPPPPETRGRVRDTSRASNGKAMVEVVNADANTDAQQATTTTVSCRSSSDETQRRGQQQSAG